MIATKSSSNGILRLYVHCELWVPRETSKGLRFRRIQYLSLLSCTNSYSACVAQKYNFFWIIGLKL